MIHDELATKEIVEHINSLIYDGIREFHNIPADDRTYLNSLIYKADDTWSYESIIENDYWDVIRNSISKVLKYPDGTFDKSLCDVLREVIPDYFEKSLEEIFDEQLSNYKCEVRHGASDAEIEGMMYDKQRI